jgi:hypothetical protein
MTTIELKAGIAMLEEYKMVVDRVCNELTDGFTSAETPKERKKEIV